MFTKLRIQNFKSWEDTGEIRMAPLTLFFGANSSGKSSLGQFLIMLRQTIESQDRRRIFHPGSEHTAVELGSFSEMVFRREADRSIRFAYQWKPAKPLEFADPVQGKDYAADSVAFSAETGPLDKAVPAPVVKRFQYRLFRENREALAIGMELAGADESGYNVFASGYELIASRGGSVRPESAVRFYGFPDEVVAGYRNADFVQRLNLAHERLFRSIHYLGPLRTRPRRLYSWAGHAPEDVGPAGENTIACLLAGAGRTVSAGPGMPAKRLPEFVAAKLVEMELIDKFQVTPIAPGRQEYEVKVRARGSDQWIDLPDVGFGVSQVLPVLVQCLYAERNSIVVLEQPEIHLHPKAQSLLADAMIDVINSREDGEDRNIQLIIETHSEHFLTRLQRRIAEKGPEKRVSHDQVSAYFAAWDGSRARLEPLEIDSLGNIRNWPEDFFGDTMGDVVARTEAQAKRIRGGERVDD